MSNTHKVLEKAVSPKQYEISIATKIGDNFTFLMKPQKNNLNNYLLVVGKNEITTKYENIFGNIYYCSSEKELQNVLDYMLSNKEAFYVSSNELDDSISLEGMDDNTAFKEKLYESIDTSSLDIGKDE